MSTLHKQHPTLPALTLTLFGVVSILGLAYCILALTGTQPCALADCSLVLYGAYFAVCGVSILGILRWKRWGVYALASASFSLAVIALLQDQLRFQEALTGVLLATAAAFALRPVWQDLD